MIRTLWFATLVLLVFSGPAFAQADSREARERLLRDLAIEPAERSATGVEALATTEQIVNGGFELGQAPGPGLGYSGTSGSWNWTTSDGMLNPVWDDPPSHTGAPTARTGAWCVYFAPFGPVSNSISQRVTIPSGASANLSFWVKIGTFETSSLTAYDTLSVRLTSESGTTLTTLATYSNLTLTPGFAYVQKVFDVSAWAGQTVRVHFASYNDSSNPTIFLLDDVSLAVSPTAAACTPDATTACLLNNRFKATLRYRGVFDNGAADTTAQVKPVTGFGSPNFETVFFYFNSANNIEILVKMLDQGNVDSSGRPTIAVLFGSATPLRTELTITDMVKGGPPRLYTSQFGSQAGVTDFTAFVK